MRRDNAEETTPGRGETAPALRLPEDVRAEARRQPDWEADVVGLPVEVPGSSGSYPVAVLVCAGPVVVGVDQRSFSGAEPERVAGLIETALARAASAVGAWPERLFVRHREVAEALTERLAERRPDGTGAPYREPEPAQRRSDGLVLYLREEGFRSPYPPVVEPLFYLDHVTEAARSMVEQVARSDLWPPVAMAQTWRAWGLPDEDIAALFAAAASYFQSEPWRALDDVPPLFASWPDGTVWTLSVLGSAGEERGLAVYAALEDFDAMLDVEAPEEAFADLGNWVVALSFLGRGDLPRSMQREVARAGWDVAAPDAYPVLLPMLTPGGGVSRKLAQRLAEVLWTIGSMVDTQADRITAGEPVLVDRPGGLAVEYPGEEPYDDEGEPGPSPETLPPELRDVLDELRSGRFATMEEAEAYVEQRIAAYNVAPQPDLSGLSPAQAQRLVRGQWDDGPLQLAEQLRTADLEGVDFLHNARTLLATIDAEGGVPATTAGNLKRALVRDMLHGMRWPDGWLDMVVRSNKVINEGDAGLLHRLRVVLEVAGLLHLRKGRFTVTRLGRELLDDDAAGRLMAHLFRTYFRDFDIGYGGYVDTGILQDGVPVVLARLPREAADWVDRRELASRLMSTYPAPRTTNLAAPGPALDFELDALTLASRVLGPLTWFGLLEEERSGGRYYFDEVRVRVSPLFERFILLDWEEG